MRFRRPAVHYGLTPEPATPYQRAGQVWDERLGSARVQARNWRYFAFGCLLIAGASMGDDMWWRAHRSVETYVAEMCRGEVQAVHEGRVMEKPTDPQIAQQLARFIDNVRAVSTDPVIVRQHWLDAYAYTTDRGAAYLNDYAREHDPFADIGKRSVTVTVASVVRASDKSFQIQWDEHAYVNGSSAGIEHWTAILTVVQQPPKTAAQFRANPYGIYVDGLSWSHQLAAVPAPASVIPPSATSTSGGGTTP